jgi:mannose-6-phosphate isomerase-like protein (cupin superfamily)
MRAMDRRPGFYDTRGKYPTLRDACARKEPAICTPHKMTLENVRRRRSACAISKAYVAVRKEVIMDSEELSCGCASPENEDLDEASEATACLTTRCNFITEDAGPRPFVFHLDEETIENPFYRRTIWTGEHLQLTLMCITTEIGLEVHPNLDQFIKLEQGQGIAVMGRSMNCLKFMQNVSAGDAVFVPAGTWHNVINTGDEPIKLYSIYAPPQHPAGTVHCTKADSDD